MTWISRVVIFAALASLALPSAALAQGFSPTPSQLDDIAKHVRRSIGHPSECPGGSVCESLWAAEQQAMPNHAAATKLHRELDVLRRRVGLSPLPSWAQVDLALTADVFAIQWGRYSVAHSLYTAPPAAGSDDARLSWFRADTEGSHAGKVALPSMTVDPEGFGDPVRVEAPEGGVWVYNYKVGTNNYFYAKFDSHPDPSCGTGSPLFPEVMRRASGYFRACKPPFDAQVAYAHPSDLHAGQPLQSGHAPEEIVHYETWPGLDGFEAQRTAIEQELFGPLGELTYPTLRAWYAAQLDPDSYEDPTRYDHLLRRYAPVLKFDSQGEYWNASPSTITDWWENKLLYSSGPASQPCGSGVFEHPDESGGGWGLETLVASPTPYYGTQCPPTDADHIDANGDDKAAADAFLFGSLDNHVHARAVHDSDGALWLQYWFFYYYNTQNFLGIGQHQGDWEMVQYRLGSGDVPDGATYAQHNDEEERCGWNQVEKYSVAVGGSAFRDAPVVYVAAGSQASYFVPGSHHRDNLPDDSANGEGWVRNPEPNLVLLDGPPAWAQWPGQWGEDSSSPHSPALQGARWGDPKAFHDGAGFCSNPDGSPR